MRMQIDNLSCGYGARTVIHKASFSVALGQVHCILGPNGSGKTALLKTLAGLLPPRAGNCTVNGRNLFASSAREKAEMISFVPQSHAPVFPFAVLDVVVMGLVGRRSIWSGPSCSDWTAAEQALDKTGMTSFAMRPYSGLSGGERQMVLIARALAQGSSFILLDEPASSLDFANQTKSLRLLRDLADAGHGILMSSHNPEHALRYATHVQTVHNGRITTVENPATALDSEMLERVYGLRFMVSNVCSGGQDYPVCIPIG